MAMEIKEGVGGGDTSQHIDCWAVTRQGSRSICDFGSHVGAVIWKVSETAVTSAKINKA